MGLDRPDDIAHEQAQELSQEGKCGDGGDELPVYLVGAEILATFEGEVRKLRTMQAEAHAGYHEVGRSFRRHTRNTTELLAVFVESFFS